MWNRLFTKILDSSVWLLDDQTRLVWITMLAASDRRGYVNLSSVANVAARARVSLEAASAAISALSSPDPVNPDQENEGRRIERVAGYGWLVINFEKYLKLASADQMRSEAAERQRRWRERNALSRGVTHRNARVTHRNGLSLHAELDAEAESCSSNYSTSSKSHVSSNSLFCPNSTKTGDSTLSPTGNTAVGGNSDPASKAASRDGVSCPPVNAPTDQEAMQADFDALAQTFHEDSDTRDSIWVGAQPKPPKAPKTGKPRKPRANRIRSTEEVEAIYALYPKKVQRGPALKAIEKALTQVGFDRLKDAVTRYAASQKGNDRQFIPYPASWFNAGRWDDDPAVWTEWRSKESLPRQSTAPDADDVLRRQREEEDRWKEKNS